MITSEILRKNLSYDSCTGVFIWLDRPWLKSNLNAKYRGKIAGFVNKVGYRYIHIGGALHLAHRLAWIYVYGGQPPRFIDHMNGQKDDNRIKNLRLATKSQNGMNRGAQRNNTSGFKGVYWHKQVGKWNAYIKLRGRRHSLGLFEDISAAAAAYRAAAHRLHGEFARSE
jgi:HNH endonuclease/AP2 domain